MKTTIEIPEELLIRAKQYAAGQRTTLRSLIERGLRAELRAGERTRAKPARISWVIVDGGLLPDHDVSDRAALMEWLRRRQ